MTATDVAVERVCRSRCSVYRKPRAKGGLGGAKSEFLVATVTYFGPVTPQVKSRTCVRVWHRQEPPADRGRAAPQGPLSSDGLMNHRIAAPTKNSAPATTLSRTLTGKAGNSQPTSAPGQSQQAAPAIANTIARI